MCPAGPRVGARGGEICGRLYITRASALRTNYNYRCGRSGRYKLSPLNRTTTPSGSPRTPSEA